MLFDLRGGGRRRTVQIVYISLAVIMGAGLVLFGIGGAVSGGLLDAVNQGGGSAPSASTFQKRVTQAEQATRVHPKQAAAWAALARARFQLAGTGSNFNQQTGVFSAAGKQQLTAASEAWQKHLSLAGKNPDDHVAGIMVQVYSALGDGTKAVQAQEVITQARPTATTFASLAILAYEAGQSRTGDLARQRALDLSPKDQRNTLKAQIDEAKATAASAAPSAVPSTTVAPTATPTPKKKK